jgi:GT2 family glycosyltransferase
MMVRRNVWLGCDGMSDEFFMYYEDTDFSSRLFTSGHKIGLLPQAHVIHDYDFGKGTHKWFYLERNRHLYIIRTWPFEVILTLLPLLLISELGLIFVSIIQRRLKLKIKSYFSTFKLMPWAIKTRISIQKSRTISAFDFMQSLEPTLSTPLLGKIAEIKLLNTFFIFYHRISLTILKIFVFRKSDG